MAAQKQTTGKNAKGAKTIESIRQEEIRALTSENGSPITEPHQLYRNALSILEKLTEAEFNLLSSIKPGQQITFSSEFYSDNAGAIKVLYDNGLVGLINSGQLLESSIALTDIAKVVLRHQENIESIRKATARQNDFLHGASEA